MHEHVGVCIYVCRCHARDARHSWADFTYISQQAVDISTPIVDVPHYCVTSYSPSLGERIRHSSRILVVVERFSLRFAARVARMQIYHSLSSYAYVLFLQHKIASPYLCGGSKRANVKKIIIKKSRGVTREIPLSLSLSRTYLIRKRS